MSRLLSPLYYIRHKIGDRQRMVSVGANTEIGQKGNREQSSEKVEAVHIGSVEYVLDIYEQRCL
jgi:hypothetical protein